jgi:uncharacterized protein
MRQSRFPLRLNVGFVLSLPLGESREVPFEFSKITLAPELEMSDFKGQTRFGRARQGILLQGDFEAWINQECTRCLEPFPYRISTHVEELYALDESNVTESGLILPQDGNIDLAPIVREYLTMEIPIQPICKPDCKGLCPECGQNLNQGICSHRQET